MTAPEYTASVLETMVVTIESIDREQKRLVASGFTGDLPLAFAGPLGPRLETLVGERVRLTVVPAVGDRDELPLIVAVSGLEQGEFWRTPSLEELEEARGPNAIRFIDELPTDIWPEGESVDEFLAAAMRGRGAYPE